MMDFSGMSLIKLKKEEMEAQVRLLNQVGAENPHQQSWAV